MATLYDIKSSDWSISKDTLGNINQGYNDINQCILNILSTQRGSDPLRPEFGVPIREFIDQPINSAVAELIRECVDQITEFEPRIEIIAVGKKIENSQVFLTFNYRDARTKANRTVTQSFQLNG